MIISLRRGLGSARAALLKRRIRRYFPEGRVTGGGESLHVVAPASMAAASAPRIEALVGVERVDLSLSESCPRVCGGAAQSKACVRVGNASFGPGNYAIIAGPCAVEDGESYLRLARSLKAAGAQLLRGAVFKPRSSPYTFQGMGLQGLRVLAEVKRRVKLPVVTEITDPRQLPQTHDIIDMVQVGARNMRNYELLKELGSLDIPVMLKRGQHASLCEWLLCAEYILKGGNQRVILCERGDAAAAHAGPVINLNMAVSAMENTPLPVIVDVSHGTGRRSHVLPIARAAAAIGAGGIMVEVHLRPEESIVDGKQSLDLDEFRRLVRESGSIRKAC